MMPIGRDWHFRYHPLFDVPRVAAGRRRIRSRIERQC